MSKGKKIGIFLGVTLLIIYIIGVVYFSSNTFPKTSVNGVDKSLISLDKLFINDSGDSQKLLIKGRDKKELTISGKDINLKKTVKGKPESSQNAFLWPIGVFVGNKYEVEYNTSFNEEAIVNILKNSPFSKNMEDPVDAHIDVVDGKYQIIPEKAGSKLDMTKLKEEVVKALAEEKSELDIEELYAKPKVNKDDSELLAEFERIKKIVEANYIFDFVDRKYELTGQEFLKMHDNIGGRFILNEDLLLDYIAKIARETDTYRTERKFNATGIGEISVPGGIYGWQMNVRKTAEKLLAMQKEGKSGKVEIVYNDQMTAMDRSSNDIGNTYIEVDLSRQKMWYYVDGELYVETDIVSGYGLRKDTATPVGVNKVWSKEIDTNLNGIHALTGQKYTYPVKYWMPVGWTGSGIHDTYSRDAYGGNIYLTGGSNSCINTPLDAVKMIFDRVEIGTPVVIYESSTSYSLTEFEKQDLLKN